MSAYLQDKVVAVTGSGRGIGRSIALLAAAEGAKVVVADYGVSADGTEPSSTVADEVVAEIQAAGGEAVAVASDVGTMAGGESVVTAAMDTWGRLDGAVCVAGILRERMLFNMSEEEFDDVIRVHLKGTFTVYRAAAAIMRKQDGGGSLIGFTSGVWALGSVAQANYSAAKGGIVSLTYSAAVGLERYGVRANVIAPVARTRMSANVPMQLAENGDPEDIAPMVAYLLGDQSKHITGQVYSVVGNKIAVWSQPREVRAMYNDSRWTPELIEERLPATVKFERLPFLDMVAEMKRAGREGEAERLMAATAPMLLSSLSDDAFRSLVREWLDEHVVGEYAALKGRGGPGDEDIGFDVRVAWEKELGAAGWIGIGWPESHGGRGASVAQQIIWAEEYTHAQAPARVNHMGEHLLGPTLIEYGTPEQCERFLPGILHGNERWCQGYSEPNAGSDLANVQTKAVCDGDEWVINGQKVWTSLAHVSHWCFLVARTDASSARHKGLSFLLVPMDQPGVETRIIRQITGGGEFNETFFTDARTSIDLLVGERGEGWRVAMGLLGFERGISTLAQQVGFERELEATIALARARGLVRDPVVRQRLARAHIGLRLMRYSALRSMGAGVPGPEASIGKLFWGSWHRDLGELMIDLGGAHSLITDGAPYELSLDQKLFLFTRADTIYGGSNEIQRNVIGERVLGLPKEPQ